MIRRLLLLACCAPLTAAMWGCVMPDQISQIQKDLADVRQEMNQLRTDQADALQKLAEMQAQPDETDEAVSRADLADIGLRIDRVARDTAIADERMNDLGRRFDRFSGDLEQTRELLRRQAIEPVAPGDPSEAAAGGPEPGLDNPPGAALVNPDTLFNTAYADFSKGNYQLAILGFEEYLEKFPTNPKADNALYWIGECNFSQGNFPAALIAFDRLLETYPRSDRAAGADLKKALTFREQSQIDQAIVQLEYVVSTYAGSDEARVARNTLTSLGAGN